MNLIPYVFFNGRCEEAAHFYADALGGEVGAIHRLGACVAAAKDPEAVQHTDVSVDGKIRFDNLVTEGVVIVPLAPSFFSPAFGMLTDKFGVSWIVTAAA